MKPHLHLFAKSRLFCTVVWALLVLSPLCHAASPKTQNVFLIITDGFPYIFNIQRSHLSIWPAWESDFQRFEISPPQYVTELVRDTTPLWEDLTYDSFLFHAAADYLKRKHPRLMFIGFGETDEWAHAGRYDLYLAAAHHVDEFIRRLWEMAQ